MKHERLSDEKVKSLLAQLDDHKTHPFEREQWLVYLQQALLEICDRRAEEKKS